MSHSFELLSEIIRIMKPDGFFYAKENSDSKISTNLKLTGFCNTSIDTISNTFSAQKPAFEVGSSSALSFANKPAVWSLSSGLVDDDIELINEDDLLDEDDLVKPAAESLKGMNLPYLLTLL